MEFTKLIHIKINWALVGPNIGDAYFKIKINLSEVQFLLLGISYLV